MEEDPRNRAASTDQVLFDKMSLEDPTSGQIYSGPEVPTSGQIYSRPEAPTSGIYSGPEAPTSGQIYSSPEAPTSGRIYSSLCCLHRRILMKIFR